jgi:hypothetical protein
MILRVFKFLLFLTLFAPLYLSAQDPITTYPYIEDFEAGSGGWTVQGVNPSWELGTPASSFGLDTAGSGNNSWVTNLTGFYNSNENSWVESPVFDLSSLSTPYLQLYIWWKIDFIDGAVLQSSIDNGISWQNVGIANDQPNWFNAVGISIQPGGSSVGWSGNLISTQSGGWLTTYHYLDGLEGQENVRFRILLASDSFRQNQGFAFDKFLILEEPCYAGEDNEGIIIGCVSETVNLNYLLTSGTIENGTWTALDGLAITSNGDINTRNIEDGNYRFSYTVTTGGGVCNESATIAINFLQALSAGVSNTEGICGFESISRSAMFDIIELYFEGPSRTGIWTDPNGFEVEEWPILPSVGDVYTYTHAANGGCPEVSSTVTFVEKPSFNAGESPEIEDLSCNPSESILDLNSRLINADPVGEWRNVTSGPGDNIEIVSSTGGDGEPIDEVDFGTLSAGAYSLRFQYTVPDDCDSTTNSTATISFDLFISTSGAQNITIALCEDDINNLDFDSFLNQFIFDDGTANNDPWSYSGPGNYGDFGSYAFQNTCGDLTGDVVNVYLNAVRPKIMLQGAMLNPNVGEDNLMRDDLRVLGLLPNSSPYGDNAPISGNPFSVTGPNAIVDWVWVELRSDEDNTYIVTAQSALVQRDGDVVGLDGTSVLCLKECEFCETAISGNYYVAIKHRNHLAVMTANPIPIGLSYTETVIDFTDANNVITFGTDAQTSFGMPTNTLGMWAGDVDNNGVIQYVGSQAETPSILAFIMNDPSNTLELPTWPVTGYHPFDTDLNATVQYVGSNSELPFILQNIYAFPGNIFDLPSQQIEQQLPD